jgi:hypothetical protein
MGSTPTLRVQSMNSFVPNALVSVENQAGEIEPAGTIRDRADAVFPIVTGEKIAAGIAHDRDAELLGEIGDVLAKSLRVRGRMAGLEYAGINAPPHMLDESSEYASVDIRNGEVAINDQAG